MTDWKQWPDRVSVEVRIKLRDGGERIETWEGISRRHAVWEARYHYRHDETVIRADLADGEPV